eukprot:1160610-Pelagomonas_calceolata.AAC.20
MLGGFSDLPAHKPERFRLRVLECTSTRPISPALWLPVLSLNLYISSTPSRNSSSSISNPGAQASINPVNEQQGGRSSYNQGAPAPHHSAPAHPPPAVGAAAPGQNAGGAVKKGQAASTDQDSRALARKIAQAINATYCPPRRYGTTGGYVGPPSYGNGLPAF